MMKREKILLALTMLVVVYALIDFFILGKKDPGQKTGQLIEESKQNAENFVTSSMAKILKIQMEIKQADWDPLISKIESDWERDPFVKPLKPKKQVSESTLSGIIYSGYMSVGKLSFAIINGIEYRTGETITADGYKVMKITPKKVVLQKDTKQAVIFLKED